MDPRSLAPWENEADGLRKMVAERDVEIAGLRAEVMRLRETIGKLREALVASRRQKGGE